MKRIFGETDKFAIEVKGELAARGSVVGLRVWVNKKSFGQIEDEGVAGVSVSAFYSLVEDKGLHELEGSLSDIGNKLKEGCFKSIDKAKFRSPGESFDDFYIFVGKKGGDVIFTWTLIDSPFHEYPEYKYGINQEHIDLEYFRKVVRMFMASVGVASEGG